MTVKTVGDIPQIGYGTWQLLGEDARNGVLWALEAGYRHIDTAQGYDNEADVGRGIRDSAIPRNDIFVTTKVKPDNFGPGAMMPSVRESLDKLGVEAVDLLLLHWPSPQDQYPLETYVSQLAEIYDAGLAKRIGVSNFTRMHIDETLQLLGDRHIATNQVECHVYLQNLPIVDYCQGLNIPVTAYAPLARGKVLGDAVLKDIAATHNAGSDQIALAYLVAKGLIIIPSSSKKERIASNFAAGNITLSDAEITRIEALDKGMRLINGAHAPTGTIRNSHEQTHCFHRRQR
ncbi:2,5-diketo-D-gluconate reductase B [Devosia pacifica]|uniref:2,5-diketo-D-gluconate reductase B n=1 Tax=Devosia pacifica TaxID=1335967 RepID=A0A918SC19_9HYPH|nr:aldo/keto reductase [Devosia pacifica]GHA32682.1 2,5-diketo-D-gluconate reductase B [Devosia pacifica]